MFEILKVTEQSMESFSLRKSNKIIADIGYKYDMYFAKLATCHFVIIEDKPQFLSNFFCQLYNSRAAHMWLTFGGNILPISSAFC